MIIIRREAHSGDAPEHFKPTLNRLGVQRALDVCAYQLVVRFEQLVLVPQWHIQHYVVPDLVDGARPSFFRAGKADKFRLVRVA